ncbi:MAG: exonuclease SbcCD subunit D [Ruminococcus sp.]|nr:exonuclease SbcCD subunit D [Ruminococcus sp.]
MKMLHISDLHLGKKVCDFPMLDLQDNILRQILAAVDSESPDCVIIAGDVYDKSSPPTQAVTMFDNFLTDLVSRNVHIFIISGNHDSPERLSFGAHIMEACNVHISGAYKGIISPVTLTDHLGEVDFYMLPFLRPSTVRPFFKDIEIKSYNDAVNTAIDAMHADFSRRCVIISHQFVTGAVTSDSEELTVGGLENVDAAAYDGFDYAALGHIHKPQNVGSVNIRYSGTPLKYSFSEANQQKSVTIAELGEKGDLKVSEIPLVPELDMREIKGCFEDIYSGEGSNDLVHITLTDEQDISDAIRKLRKVYPNVLRLDYDNKRTQMNTGLAALEVKEGKTPAELFSEFYFQRNNAHMSEVQLEFVKELINNIWEEQS